MTQWFAQNRPRAVTSILTSTDPINFRPNDGSGVWPDSSNTGYLHAPGYPGSLSNGGSLTITSNTTYNFYDFNGGINVGSVGTHADNVTFFGCRFYGVAPGNNLVAIFGSNCTFQYCTFAPNTGAPSYVTYANSYQYAIIYDGGSYGTTTGQLTVDHCEFWGWGNCIQVNGSTQSAPHSFTSNYFHHAGDNGGSTYHQDAILCTVGGANEKYVTINGNTFDTEGNTNAIAMQLDGGSYYDHITAKNNYLSGLGYTTQIGGNGTGNSFIVFTGNIWSTETVAQYGPLYGWTPGNTGDVWNTNRYQIRSGDPANPVSLPVSANGQYWWPTDNSGHAADYTGN